MPYASMLLEAREGEAAAIPLERIQGRAQADRRRPPALLCGQPQPLHDPRAARAPLSPASGPSRSPASTASDQEIADYYNANQATYAAKETRDAQPGGRARPGDARTPSPARAKAGATLRRGAAGANAAVSSLDAADPRGLCLGRRRQGRGGGLRRAVRARSSARSSPISAGSWSRSNSVKTDRRQVARRRRAPKSPPSSPPTSASRRSRMWSTRSRTRVDDGSNFAEAAAAGEAAGDDHAAGHGQRQRRAPIPAYSCPPSSRRRSRPGSRSRANDPPEIVSAARRPGLCDGRRRPQIVPAAPAPLASIRDRVADDWIDGQATAAGARPRRRDRRQGARRACRSPTRSRQRGAPLPPVRPIAARRIQIAEAQGPVAAGDADSCSR